MTYANWKAKQTLGANLEGEYPKTRNIPYSEIGNKLRKQQLEEERRLGGGHRSRRNSRNDPKLVLPGHGVQNEFACRHQRVAEMQRAEKHV